jgi:hypothetical protein
MKAQIPDFSKSATVRINGKVIDETPLGVEKASSNGLSEMFFNHLQEAFTNTHAFQFTGHGCIWDAKQFIRHHEKRCQTKIFGLIELYYGNKRINGFWTFNSI